VLCVCISDCLPVRRIYLLLRVTTFVVYETDDAFRDAVPSLA